MYYGVHTSDQDYVPYANFQYPNGVVLLGNTAANNNHLPLIDTLHKNNNRHTHTLQKNNNRHTHTHTLHKNNNVVKHKKNCVQVQNLILLYISQ